jgi:ABC-type phosphate/phosphonate transport system substrate-binding protein
MIRRHLLAVLAGAGLALAGCNQPSSITGAKPKEITFSILSAESQTSMGPLWTPLLNDLSKQVGVPVKPYFASNYTSLVEAMRFGQVQMGWFSAMPALEAVNRADAEVLGRVVDAGGDATNNTVGLLFAQRENPELAAKVETIWTSPPLPESSILVRKDLDPALKEKIRQFFLTYGTGTGPEADRQRGVLKGLAYGGFRPADNSYLDPVREMIAAQALGEARKSGDKAKIAQAQAEFDRIQAAAAQRRAANPDV